MGRKKKVVEAAEVQESNEGVSTLSATPKVLASTTKHVQLRTQDGDTYLMPKTEASIVTYGDSTVQAGLDDLMDNTVRTVSTSGTSPLTLSASKSGTTVTVSGSVNLANYATTANLSNAYNQANSAYNLANTANATANSALTNVSASGTSPLTLSASKSGTTVTISGSVNLSNYATTANLANVYNQANAAYDAANSAQSTADSAYSKANDAYTLANTANATANTANTTAKNAYNAANTAQSSADAAQSTADDAYAKANSAYTLANTANATANTANTTAKNAYNQANNAYNQANSANTLATSANTLASTANTTATNAYNQANSAYSLANSANTLATSANTLANTANSTANSAYSRANTAYNQANDAYNQANSANTLANTANSTANSAYSRANSAYNQANDAYNQANSANALASTANTTATSAYSQANNAYNTANSAYSQANNAYNTANDAYNAANAAQATADSKQDKLTAGTGISISSNTISCTLDTTIAKVVTSLPTAPDEEDKNKIFLVPSSTTGTQNIYTEYIYVDGAWEKLGEYSTSVDLSGYLTIANAANTYATQSDLNTVSNTANSAYSTANSAYTQANNAYNTANSANSLASTANTTAANAYNQANSAYNQANTANSSAGNAAMNANLAYNHANAAYNVANEAMAAVDGKQDKLKYYTEGSSTAEIALDSDKTAIEVAENSITLWSGDGDGSVKLQNNVLTYNEVEVATVNDIPTLSGLGGVGTINASGTSPLTLSASKSGTTVTITGSVDTYNTATIDSMINTATAGGLTSVTASGTSPLTLSANVSGTTATITGSVDLSDYATSANLATVYNQANAAYDQANSAYTLANTANATANSAVASVSASGTSPLTLSASKSGTAVTISGSVDLSDYAKTDDVGILPFDGFYEYGTGESSLDILWVRDGNYFATIEHDSGQDNIRKLADGDYNSGGVARTDRLFRCYYTYSSSYYGEDGRGSFTIYRNDPEFGIVALVDSNMLDNACSKAPNINIIPYPFPNGKQGNNFVHEDSGSGITFDGLLQNYYMTFQGSIGNLIFNDTTTITVSTTGYFTFSCMARLVSGYSQPTAINFLLFAESVNMIDGVTLNTETWTRISATGTFSSDTLKSSQNWVRVNGSGTRVQLGNFKLEAGSTATAWQPSLRDLGLF